MKEVELVPEKLRSRRIARSNLGDAPSRLAIIVFLISAAAFLTGSSCAKEEFSLLAASQIDLDLGREFEGGLAGPSKVPMLEIDSGRVYVVSFQGVDLLFSEVGSSLVRMSTLPYADTCGLLDPSVRLSSFEVHAERNLQAVVLEYVCSDPRESARFSFFELCLLADAAPRGECQKVDVWQAENGSLEEMRKAGPKLGLWAVACPLVRDHNQDGYQDLVLWRRWWTMSRTEPVEVLELEREEMLWLPFNRFNGRFETARPLKDLWPANEACWEEWASVVRRGAALND